MPFCRAVIGEIHGSELPIAETGMGTDLAISMILCNPFTWREKILFRGGPLPEPPFVVNFNPGIERKEREYVL